MINTIINAGEEVFPQKFCSLEKQLQQQQHASKHNKVGP